MKRMKVTLLFVALLVLSIASQCQGVFVQTNEATFLSSVVGLVAWTPDFRAATNQLLRVETANGNYLDENTYIPYWIPSGEIPFGVYIDAFDDFFTNQNFRSDHIHLVRNFPGSASAAPRTNNANAVLADSNHYFSSFFYWWYGLSAADGMHVHFSIPVNDVGFQLEKAPGCSWSNFAGGAPDPEPYCRSGVETLQGIPVNQYFNDYLTVYVLTNQGNYYITIDDNTYGSAFDFNYFMGLQFDANIRVYDIYIYEPYRNSNRAVNSLYQSLPWYSIAEVNPRLVGFNWMEFGTIRTYCKNFPVPAAGFFGPIDGANFVIGTADFDETDFGDVGIYILDMQIRYSWDRISTGQQCSDIPTSRSHASPNEVSFTASTSIDGGGPIVYGEDSILLMPNGTYPQASFAAGPICLTFTDNALNTIPQDQSPVSGAFRPIEPFSDHNVGECTTELAVSLETGDNIPNGDATCIYSAFVCIQGQTPPPTPSSGTCQNLDGYLNDNGDFLILDPGIIAPNSVGCFNEESLSQDTFSCVNVGANMVTWTGLDSQGRSASCTATVTIFDTIPPEASCQNTYTAFLDASGQAIVTDPAVFNNPVEPSTDNCPLPTTPYTTVPAFPITYTCADIQAFPSVSLRVTDASGNFDTCTSIVQVVDNIPPAVTCLAGTSATVGTPIDIVQSSTDNCGTPFLANNIVTPKCSEIGNGVLYGPATATDASGNSASCTASLNVVDNVAPVAVCRPGPITLVFSGNSYTVQVSDVNGGSYDNCQFSLSVSPVTLTCSSPPTDVTLTATDASGNSNSCVVTVQVANNGPVANCAQGVVVGNLDPTSGIYSVLPSAVDAGSGVGCGSSSSCTGFSCTTVSPSTLDCENIFFGTNNANTVVVTITDPATRLQDSCVASVRVQDVTNPIADCKTTITLDYNDACIASTTASFVDDGSIDNCGRDNLSFSISPASWTFTASGQSQTTLTVTDRSSLSSTCQTTVLLRDVTTPTALCQDHEISLNNAVESIPVSAIDASSVDNCGVTQRFLSQNSVSCQDAGKAIDVVLSVFDQAGNLDTCVGTVYVTDDINPTARCSTNTRVSVGSNGESGVLTVNQIDANSNDACGISSMFLSGTTTYSCVDVGTFINPVLNVVDNSQNTASCQGSVFVQDLFPPDANCVAEKTLFAGATGTVTVTPSDLDDPSNPSTDNCPNFSLSIVGNSLLNCGFRDYITLRNIDQYGNIAECATYVTVLDAIDPSISCRSTTVDIGSDGKASIITSDVVVSATDNCGTPSVRLSKTGFTCFDLGFVQVTATATDTFGNSNVCTSTVAVQDLLDPVAQCKAEIVLGLDANGEVTANGLEANAGSYDNCIDLSYVVTPSKFTCDDLGTLTGNLTVIDGAGNLDSCSLSIVIADDISPEALCADYTVTVPSDFNGVDISPDNIDFGSFDNCGISDIRVSPNNVGLGETRVTLTVTDSSGNVDSCTATVTVVRVEDNPSSGDMLSLNYVLFFLLAFMFIFM